MDIEKSKMNQIKFPIWKFGLNRGCLTTSFNDTTFIKCPLIFIIQFISSLIFFNGNKIILNTFKKHSNFHIFLILCL